MLVHVAPRFRRRNNSGTGECWIEVPGLSLAKQRGVQGQVRAIVVRPRRNNSGSAPKGIEVPGLSLAKRDKALLVMPCQKGYRTHAIFCCVDGIFFFLMTGSNGYRRRSLLGRTASIFSHGSNSLQWLPQMISPVVSNGIQLLLNANKNTLVNAFYLGGNGRQAPFCCTIILVWIPLIAVSVHQLYALIPSRIEDWC